MTRFYFHVHDGTHAFLDDGGLDLPGEAAALAEARQTAWALIYDLQHKVTAWSAWAVEVTDETGRSLSTLHFNDLLVPKGKPESQGWCGSLRCVALPATRPESSAATTGTAMSRAEIRQKRSHHSQLPNAVMSGADDASA